MSGRAMLGALVAVALVAGCAGQAETSGDFEVVPGIGTTRVDVPRPTPRSSPGCTAALRTDQTIAERVADLRRIGLFADRAQATDAELSTEVEAAIVETWGDQLDADDPYMDLIVAEQDDERTWWQDLEADVGDGNDVYEAMLEEWGAIAAGAFDPTDIAETWTSEAGPVTVTFDLDGTQHELRPAYLEDWIDPRVATSINELIASSGRQFEFFKAFDQTAFVMALTADERTALEGRGWCFE